MYPEATRNFESNKILAGVGALLVAVGSFLPFAGSIGIVSIVGIILVLIGIRGLADDFKDYSIFRNALTGFIFEIIAIFIGVAIFSSFLFGIRSVGFPIFNRGGLGIALWVVLGLLILVFLFFLLGAVFFRQAFSSLAGNSGEGNLRTSGLLLLVGAALIIVFGLGFLLIFIAWILIAVGFFSMKSPTQNAQAHTAMSSQTAPTISSSGNVKYCIHCGAENKIDGTFCTHCGRRLAASETA